MSNEMTSKIEAQLKIFQSGIPMLELAEATKKGTGIRVFSDPDVDRFVKIYDHSKISVEKFVPASGAATRMFKDLLEAKNNRKANAQSKIFFRNLDKFSFDLSGSNEEEIFSELFGQKRMDQLPKGQLPFHSYDGFSRTAAEEHLAEGLGYAEKQGTVKLHFTVSPEHLDRFKKHLEVASKKFSIEFKITYSTQSPETDTIAVDLNNEPVKDEHGKLLFRPAGHGALLGNLNHLDSDLIFIKNIDNVVPDRLKEDTIKYKKVLAGVLLGYQQGAFDLLKKNEAGQDVLDEGRVLLMGLGLNADLSDAEVIEKLNRPIRVCGMVRNQGEPGGGPFWVRDKKGNESLQIVESAQIDHSNADQETIFKQSTHFNPVDLVCGVKNYKGEKFDLMKYRDPNTGFISHKSYNGQAIKALELPGLWNGSMADWNTIFVEVPLITFNPVKTVNDLVKPEHQG